jgi:CubicO group peptidase (beta-lactamase class C family)
MYSLKMIKYLAFFLPFVVSCSVQKAALPLEVSEKSSYNYMADSSILAFFEKLPDSTELSIGFYEDGNADFLGIRKIGGELSKVENRDGIFEIGSISKVFTSLLMSQFVTSGKLALSDPLQSHIDFPLNTGDNGYDPNNVTLLQLSNHTSGLVRLPADMLFNKDIDGSNPFAHYTKEDLEDHLKTNFYRQNPAGKVYGYSNLGVGILSYVLEKKSNKTYDVLLHEAVFDDLSMSSSGCSIKDSARLVSGRDLNGKVKNWDFASLEGAGAIKSTVTDMMKFLSKNMSTTDAAYLMMRDSTFSVNEKMNIGLAWHLIKKEEQEVLFHNGGTGGYASSLVIDIASKKGIIILSNMSAIAAAGKVDEIAFGWIGK